MKKKQVTKILIDEYQLNKCVEVQVFLGNVDPKHTEQVITKIKNNILIYFTQVGDVFEGCDISVGNYIVMTPVKVFDNPTNQYLTDTVKISLYSICENRPFHEFVDSPTRYTTFSK
jgi:hypothetical protein